MRACHLEHLGGGGGFWNMIRLFRALGAAVIVMGYATGYDHQRTAAAALDSLAVVIAAYSVEARGRRLRS
jgi:hypothetical protein